MEKMKVLSPHFADSSVKSQRQAFLLISSVYAIMKLPLKNTKGKLSKGGEGAKEASKK